MGTLRLRNSDLGRQGLSAPATRTRWGAALPFLVVPYDSLTYLLGADLHATAQSLPATAVLSIAYLALRGQALRTCTASRTVLSWLGAACAAMVVVTLANIAIEAASIVDADTAARVPTALRQGLSFALGLSTFLMFQDALLRLGVATAFKWLLIGSLPTLAMVIVEVGSGAFRVQGFSSEPSLLADMLVWAFLPGCLVAAWPRLRRRAMAALGAGALLVSFSTTGFLKAAIAVLAHLVSRGQALRALLVLPALAAAVYALLRLFPDNYVFLVLSYMQVMYEETGELMSGSFIDRFFGLAGPLSMLGDPRAWLGYGLGADTVYFDRLFDSDTAAAIREVKGDIPSISSLQGKMLLYAGVWGYALYAAAWYVAWRNAPQRHLARVMLPAIFMASMFSLGPLFLPYVWLWLAVGATAAGASPSTPPSRAPAAPPTAR